MINFIRKQENIISEGGKKLMYKKDNKTKETFGDLKENIGHDRLYRRGHDNVQMEMYLVAMGHNIREYHKRKMKQKRRDQEDV
ncbi:MULTISPECIES: transposase [Catenibacterium]|uniref:transposase n=1 Tax=Catenibacterium TaxID=135858 RepID=UPI00257CE0A8|nr:transposase [Catenibacterium sp. UBA627]